MDEIYRHIGRFASQGSPEQLKMSPHAVDFQATDLWRDDGTGTIRAEHPRVTVNDTSKWLAAETRESAPAGKESLVVRLVWVQCVNAREVFLPHKSAVAMLERFRLGLAYEYLQSTITGVNAFPRTTSSDGAVHQAFAFSFAPKLAVIWSHSEFPAASGRPPVTYALVLVEIEEKDRQLGQGMAPQHKQLRGMAASGWDGRVVQHCMFPALLCGILLDLESAGAVAKSRQEVWKVERRTGYSKFRTKRDDAATGELIAVSALMSGTATKLASVERKSKALEKLMAFILERVGSCRDGVNQHTVSMEASVTGDDLVRNHAGVLQNRVGMQILDTAYMLKRVQVQIEALVNLIGQTDSINNTDIALSSHRDASSMKTLAVVTMFFLPGSFISALFSTDFFDWDNASGSSIGVSATPQFALYWIITIPLTVLTFGLYVLWLRREEKRRDRTHKKQDAKVDELVQEKPPTPEVDVITKRRESTLRSKSGDLIGG